MKIKIARIVYYVALFEFLISFLFYLSSYPQPSITVPSIVGLTILIGLFVVTPLSFWVARGLKAEVTYNINQIPRWLLSLMVIAVINLLMVMFAPAPGKGQGVTEVRDGHYYIVSHGKTIKELTYDEYNLRETLDSRVYLSFFIVWYLICAYLTWLTAFGKSLRNS